MAGEGSVVARLRVEFLGDAAKYDAARAKAEADGKRTAKTIGDAFRDAMGKSRLGGDLIDARSIAAGLRSGKATIGEVLKGVARDAGADLRDAVSRGLGTGGRMGANLVRSALGGLKAAAGKVFEGLLIGSGIAAFTSLTSVIERLVGAIPDLVSRGQDYARTVDEITKQTGASVEASSRFAASLVYLGESTGSTSQIISQLVRNLPAHAAELERMGVTVRDNNGRFLDAITIIDNVRSSFSRMADGTDKARRVVELFGGRGALGRLAEYLQLTDGQMELLNAHFEQTGQVLSTETNHIAEEARRAGNDIQGVLNGLATQLLVVVGPGIEGFFSSLAAAIAANAETIRDTVGQVLSWIMGLVSGLAGIDIGSSVTAQIGAIGRTNPILADNASRMATLTTELAALEDQQKSGAKATDAGSAAIKGQVKAIDGELAALAALSKQQDAVYRKRLDSIRAILDERRAQLDAAEAARDLARQQQDLNASLNAAQIALAAAQAKGDADAVARAQGDIAELRQRAADMAHDQEVAAQRQSIADTRAYVDHIAEIVEKGESRKAIARTLGRKEDALTAQLAAAQAAGDDERARDLQSRLDAVKAGLERNAAGTAIDAQRAALEQRKAMLSEEVSAVRSASAESIAARIEETRRKIEQLRKEDAADRANIDRAKSRIHELGPEWDLELRDPKGPVQSAFEAARLKGVAFADDVKAHLEGLLETIGNVADALGRIFAPLVDAWNRIPEALRGFVTGGLIGGAIGGPVGAAVGGAAGSLAQLAGTLSSVTGQNKDLLAALAELHSQSEQLARSGSPSEIADAIRALQERIKALEAEKPAVPGLPGNPAILIALRSLGEDVDLLRRAQGHAAGGIVGLRGPELGILGERGPEVVLSSRVLEALGRLNAAPERVLATVAAGPAAVAAGGQPVVIRLEIGGRPLLDFIDEHLAWRRGI